MRRCEAALRLYRELDDARGIAGALQVLGSVSREQGRYARAMELHAESLAVAEAMGDRWGVASAHSYLAFASWLQRDFARAAEEASIALAASRELGDIEGAAWALISLGTVARYQGEIERAVLLLTESRALSEGIGFREGIAWSAEQLGLLGAVDGDPAAITLLRRSLELHTELRDRWRMSSVLEDLAAIALALGQERQAARLLGAAEAIRDAIGTVIAPCERPQHLQTLAAVRSALGEEQYAAARQQGLVATMDELAPDLPAPDDAAPVAPPRGAPPQTAPTQSGPPQAGPSPAAAAPVPPTAAEPADGHPRPSPARARARAAQQAARSAAATGPLRVRTLGAAAVEFGEAALTAADWGYAKPRELMFLLVSSPPLTKDQIAAALWPDLSRQQLGNALHTALRELRRALGDPGWVVYADGRYRFDRSRPHECDVTTFEDALAAARRARPAEAALPDLQRAVAAYGGDFLDGMSAGEWALVRRDELRRAFESALLATGRLQTAAGRHQAAAAAFRRAVAHEPLNESAHRELMSSWARLGETARAVRHYEELVTLLRDQVGVPPAAETTALYRAADGDPVGAAAACGPSPGVSPSGAPFPPCWSARLGGHANQPGREVPQVPDPIKPPAARRPEEALELACAALSDGDLEAALAQYESTAMLARWPRRAASTDRDIRGALTCFMALRLPLSIRIGTVLEADGLALVACDRHVTGTGPDGEQVALSGRGCAVVRPQHDGAWRIAADAWQLETELPPEPPEIPPVTGGDPDRGEGQGGQPHH